MTLVSQLDEDGNYPVYVISQDSILADEQLGTKRKFWLTAEDGRRWLFKFNRKQHGRFTGDDWAEGIAGELAKLLDLPCASSFLAVEAETGHRGVAVWDFTRIADPIAEPYTWEPLGTMYHGNELLYKIDENYPQHGVRATSNHTVKRISQAFSNLGIGIPYECSAPLLKEFKPQDGFDIFVGYLLFDAWICNTDRHHENWAAIELLSDQPPTRKLTLAPTYDHASSLGTLLSDEEYKERLETRDQNRTLAAFLNRGRSQIYEDDASTRGQPMLDAYRTAALLRPEAARKWEAKLGAIDPSAWRTIIDRVPLAHMSSACRDFVDHLLHEMRRRLLQ